MSELVTEFAELLKDMERALVANDVNQIDKLTAQQQTCLSEIVQSAADNPAIKQEVERAMPELTHQLKVNEALLTQAIQVNNTLMSVVYSNITAARQAQGMPNPTGYKA